MRKPSEETPWFLNHYACYRCDKHWTGEWSCQCDDDCPYCGARANMPTHSEEVRDAEEIEADENAVTA